MYIIWVIYLLFTFIFAYKKTIWGFSFLLCSRILIPECVRLTPFVDISLNTGIIIIIIIFSIRDVLLKKSKWKNYYSFRCLFFIVVLFLILLLSNYTNFKFQINRLVQFSLTDVAPVMCLSFILKTKEELNLLLKVLFGATFISCVYGCFTLLIGQNPYVDVINLIYSEKENLLNNTGELYSDRGFGATSGTFEHSNGWGYFLPITFVLFYFLYSISIKSKLSLRILLLLLSVCVVICSKRSALISFLSFFIFYLWLAKKEQKIKLILSGVCILISVYVFSLLIPQLKSLNGFIESSLFFWDDSLRDEHDIGGSSFGMRIEQIIYPYYEVRENLLFGHGFGWSNWYISKFDFHPIMFGFETILSSAVVDGGIIGLFLWGGFFCWSYKYSAERDDCKLYYKLFTIVQLTIALATGLSYFIFYGIYIVLLNKFYLLKNDENISSDSNLQL